MLLMYLYGEGLVSCKNLFPIQLYIYIDNTIIIKYKVKSSDMPNVVSAIDGTSPEIQIPFNEPQQKTYFQQTNSFH